MSSYMLYYIVNNLFRLYEILIVVWCFMSWIPTTPGSLVDDIKGAVGTLVCPYLNLFRSLIPTFGGIDFSPIVAIFALSIIRMLVVWLIV